MKILLYFVLVLLHWLPLAGLAAETNLNFVFIPKSSDQMFWELMRDGVDKAVREDGHVKLTWRGPAHNDDTDSQIRILKVYTRPGVDAILIAPTDRVRLVEPIRAAVELGIKVIVVDSGLDGSWHSNMVATDNVSGGKLAAKQMAKVLNHQGRVVVYRTVAGSASTDERADGFISYLKEAAPRISVVADVYGGGSTGRSRLAAVKLLSAHPDIDGVFTVNETATEGMLRALREKGLAGKIKLVGFDATDLFLSALRDGSVQGLVIQNPRQMGYMGIKAAVAAVHNSPIAEKTIFTDTSLVTRDNMQSTAVQKMMCVRC